MTQAKGEAVKWAYCAACGLRYSAPGVGHCHRGAGGPIEWSVDVGPDAPLYGVVERGRLYLPALPLPEGVQVRGKPKDGWGEVELPHPGYTISIPDAVANFQDGRATTYQVKRGSAEFRLRSSGRSWAAWKGKGSHEVAVTRYCSTPMAAIDALVAAMGFDLGGAEVELAGIEDLTDRLVDALKAFERHGLARTTAALEAGSALTEIRGILRHGEFGHYCQTHGLEERTAQRWMRLAASGLSAEEIQERGGIRKALQSISSPSQPPAENVQESAQEPQGAVSDAPEEESDTGGPEMPHAGDSEGAEAKPLILWTDADWEAYRAANRPQGVGVGPEAKDSAKPDTCVAFGSPRRCLMCKNKARRGGDMCRPCEYRAEADSSTRIGRLLRENRRLRKSISGLRWQLVNQVAAEGVRDGH